MPRTLSDRIYALVDCNNFYASCERLFNPALEDKPSVVLSNNDGCIIARSKEAKALGIGMGVPAFEIAGLLEEKNVAVFSTNYTLYGDISSRVVQTLAAMNLPLEVYSIDEAFIDLTGIKSPEKQGWEICNTVYKWTGIPVSVGIGATKTLSKIASRIAKKKFEKKGVYYLSEEQADDILNNIHVLDVWGIGEQYAALLEKNFIVNALELKNADRSFIKRELNVMAERTVMELNGTVCYPLDVSPETKKDICTSRSFGSPLNNFEDIWQALSSYVDQGAKKLRNRQLVTSAISVFLMTNMFAKGPRYVNIKTMQLPVPTSLTSELLKYAKKTLEKIFRKGYSYKKTGVIYSELVDENSVQCALWDQKDRDKNKKLISIVDKLNKKWTSDKIKFASEGNNKVWIMRQRKLSPKYTTRWSELLSVNIDNKTNS